MKAKMKNLSLIKNKGIDIENKAEKQSLKNKE